MVDRLNCVPGVRARRVPLSGAVEGFGGDIYADVDRLGRRLKAEVKARAGGAGWKTISGWLGGNDALILVPDRTAPLVVLPWDVFVELLTGSGAAVVAPPLASGAGEPGRWGD